MEKLISFVDAGGDSLFSATVEAIPRPGDVVRYSMEAADRGKWNDGSWRDYAELSGSEWIVSSVHHDFRRMSIEHTAHVVFVVVTPNVQAKPGATVPRCDSA